MKTLADIATAALPLLARLKPHPLDAPIEVFVTLGAIASDLEAHKKEELVGRMTILMLAVAPVQDHDRRPEKMGVFASFLVEQIETELKGFLE
jgi:hypothetical protein